MPENGLDIVITNNCEECGDPGPYYPNDRCRGCGQVVNPTPEEEVETPEKKVQPPPKRSGTDENTVYACEHRNCDGTFDAKQARAGRQMCLSCNRWTTPRPQRKRE